MPGCPKFGVNLAPRNIFSHYSHAYTQQHVDALALLTSAALAPTLTLTLALALALTLILALTLTLTLAQARSLATPAETVRGS